MKNNLIIILLYTAICSAISCKEKDIIQRSTNAKTVIETVISNDVIVYKSGPNGVADIELTLEASGEFKYYMKILSQPMSKEKDEIIISSGKWLTKGTWTQLIFSNKEINVDLLFDKTYSNEEGFKDSGTNTITINHNVQEIDIWKIPCFKEIIVAK